ncbi:YigZ family protein [Uliginosibacterium sp. sgz301328]|uniref:IMPACT family protein n=1 Tax=Uliginosibacterium sp. sgz301328 TaxID=3243764 RepID=UPI00359EAF65
MPLTIATPVHSELLIKKSRFIGCVQPVADRPSAQKIVAGLWKEHPTASHVCWALLAGGQSAAVDDGEPSGTAGRPMLDVLRHQDLEGVLATVIRYYGGIMLGAGGLVRAYTDSVAQALRGAQKIAIVRLRKLRCEAPYAFEGTVRRAIEAAGATLSAVEHGQRVSLTMTIADDVADQFVGRLNELGHGAIIWLDSPTG